MVGHTISPVGGNIYGGWSKTVAMTLVNRRQNERKMVLDWNAPRRGHTYRWCDYYDSEVLVKENDIPQEVLMEQGCTKDGWKSYDEVEYRHWIDLLLKRSTHSATLPKKIADLMEAKDYLAMLITRLIELQAQQEAQRTARLKAEAEKQAKAEKEKKKK
jgi:hypothetical protein